MFSSKIYNFQFSDRYTGSIIRIRTMTLKEAKKYATEEELIYEII